MEGLSDALDFSHTIGVDAGQSASYEQGGGKGVLGEIDFYTRFVQYTPYYYHSMKISFLR